MRLPLCSWTISPNGDCGWLIRTKAAERASALALDFMHNSGWIAGAADQIICDTIGTELKLNARPDLSKLGYNDQERAEWCRLVEAEWRRWAWNPKECDLAGKSTMRDIKERARQVGAGTAKLFWGVAEAYVSEQINRLSGLS